MRVFLAIMVVLLIVLLIFAVQNPSSTKVSFITFSSTIPLLLIILVSAVVGLLLGIAVLLPANLRRSSQIRKLESELRTVESELRTVRARSEDTQGAPPTDRHAPAPTDAHAPADPMPGSPAGAR